MKLSPHARLAFVICLLSSIHSPASAFLNANVRVDQFDWQHVQTEHFDIYYDKKEAALVPSMARYLEGAWKEVGDRVNFQVKGRTPFFFYSNHNKFEQTNIVPIGEGTGGVTEAFKNRFLIFNDGSEDWMRHVIYHEYTHVVQFNVLYGGFWKSVRLLKSPFYPLWAMEGMAEYGSGDIDVEVTEMVVRDGVYTKTLIGLPELQGFNHVKPNQVTLGYKTGEAAIRFLADEYGADKVGKLLVTMESHFDVSSALNELLGIDINRFDFRFQEYLREKYADFFDRAKVPTFYGPKLTKSDEIPQSNEGLVVSPDGKKIYYFSDRKGPTRLYELDLSTKKSRVLVNLKYMKFEYLHPQGRSISISNDGRWLAFSGEKTQRDCLYLFDLERKKLKKVKVPFDQIRSPIFSPVDDSLACVGMMNGFNDIYLITKEGAILKRVTNNPQDERDPVFSADGKSLVYSGETMTADGSGPDGRDLFSVSADDLSIRQLTALKGEEREPEILPDGSIIFVRDRNDTGELGFNLYRWTSPGKPIQSMTDMIGGAFSPRYSSANDALYYVGFYSGEKHIYQYTASSFTAKASDLASAPARKKSTNDEGVLDPRQKALTQALHTWPDGVVSPLLQGAAQPYKWKGSTDLFLPFFFYSSLDGFVIADIWQFSDLLGNHQVQQQMQYASGADLHDFALFYTYARFRPQFTFGVRSQKYFRDIDQIEQRHNTSGIALMTYPLDRINAIQAGFGVTDQKDRFIDGSLPDENADDRFWLGAFIHDTVNGRYLVPTQGRRMSLFYQEGLNTLNGNQFYRTGGMDAAQYFMMPRESTLATRLFYARSTGRDPQNFRLGGMDRIRGVTSGSVNNKKTNVVITSAEMRIKLSYLDARTKFLYPDFFFKAAYLILFDDLGYGWSNPAERDNFDFDHASNAAGVGISWPTFIIQSFKIDFTILYSKRTDNGSDIWFFTLGPTF